MELITPSLRPNTLLLNYTFAGDNDGDTPPSLGRWETSNANYEDKLNFVYRKEYGDRFLCLDFQCTPVGSPGASQGQIKLSAAGNVTSEAWTASGIPDTTNGIIALDMEDFSTGERLLITVSMKQTGGSTNFGLSKSLRLFTTAYDPS